MELTSTKFWDEYWSNCKLPSVVDMSFSFERCLATELKKALFGCMGEVLEIGCAPGRWLAFFATEIGLKPSGIEYSAAGMDATMRNFKKLNIDYGFVKSGDFFLIPPEPWFDVVVSLGFIEHFTNVDEVIGRHLRWLRPGGMLVLGVPNFRGIYRPIQAALDKTILDKHNLEIMDLGYFKRIAGIFDLRIEYLGYLGSFEPCLPIPRSGSTTPLQCIVKSFLWASQRLRRFRFLDRINHHSFSSYILAVYKMSSTG